MKNIIYITVFFFVCSITLTGCRGKQKNKKQDLITKTSENKTTSGLRYEVTEQGQGTSIQTGDIVIVHYTGWLADDNWQKGSQFDSSENREPFSFPAGVGRVIAGWDEAILKMVEGDEWTLFIPHQLAYGKYGAGRLIPPFANLIFKVKVIKVIKKN